MNRPEISKRSKLGRIVAIVAAASLGIVSLAAADDSAEDGKCEGKRGGKHHGAKLEKYDKNGDGKLDDAERKQLEADHAARAAERFKKLDVDGSGSISKKEAEAAPRLLEHFDAIDADKNGALTAAELKAHHEKRRAERGDRANRGERKRGDKSGT